MNLPPKEFVPVPHTALREFVHRAGQRVGLAAPRAELLADLLIANDLRGVFSHGTVQIATYARLLRDGVLNRDPQVSIARETPTSLLLDGDGGLGYFPAYDGTLALIEKVKSAGIGILLTRNHGHFGAAGIYSRLTLPHDLLAFVTSGHQLQLQPGRPLVTAAGGSPMSFSAPAGQEEHLVVDFGAIHDVHAGAPHGEEIARLAPAVVFRSLGLGAICQSWGGFLAGVPVDPDRAQPAFAGANQGSLVIAFRIDLFMSPEQFKREMDEYIQRVGQLQPLAGFEQSLLPGAIEARRAERFRAEGIPVGPAHRTRLEELAQELSLPVPWG